MSNITLSAGVRQNLLSLQNTAQLMATTQNRLATGKKVNSALDNPTNFFTSSALQSRAGDLNSLLDSMSNGIKTLEAADNGLKAITKTVESMQSTLRQARQDKSFKTESFSLELGSNPTGTESISFSGGAVGATAVSVGLATVGAASNAAATGTTALGTISTMGTPAENAALTGTTALSGTTITDTPAQNAAVTGTTALSGTTITDTPASAATLTAGPFSDVDFSGTKASHTTSTDFTGPVDFSAGGTITFEIDIDNSGAPATITIDGQSFVDEFGGVVGDFDDVSGDQLAQVINAALGTANVDATVAFANNRLTFTSTGTNSGSDSELQITNVGGTQAAGAGIANMGAAATGEDASIDFQITIDDGNGPQNVNITLDQAALTASGFAGSFDSVTAEDIAAAINHQANTQLTTTGVEYATVNTDGDVELSSIATGADASISVGTVTVAGGATSSGLEALDGESDTGEALQPGTLTFDVNGQTVSLTSSGGADNDGVFSAQDIADAINTQVGGSANVEASLDTDGNLVITSTGTAGAADEVTVDNFSTGDATQLGFATAAATGEGEDFQSGTVSFDVNGETVNLTSSGGTDGVFTAQQIVDAINTQVGTSAGVEASLDGDGNLVLTSTGTAGAADEVTVGNFSGPGSPDAASLLGLGATTANGEDAGPGTALTFEVNGEEVSLAAGGSYTAAEIRDAINTQVGTSAGVAASLNADGQLVVTSTGTAGASDEVTIGNFSDGDASQLGFAAQATVTAEGADGAVTAKTVDALVSEINNNEDLRGKIRASSDNGRLRIENLSTTDLDVTGVTNGVANGGTGTSEIGGNDVRKNLVKQFNELRDQLDKLADDASFNGINLLRGDKLKLTFNETGTSTIEIQAKDANGDETAVNSADLGINTVSNTQFDSDDSIDTLSASLSQSLNSLRSQASSFGSNLSIVQNRTEFTKSMMNTLQTGADALVLADTNEEAANMLALQTRQQLSSTALSLASQADQAALRLF